MVHKSCSNIFACSDSDSGSPDSEAVFIEMTDIGKLPNTKNENPFSIGATCEQKTYSLRQSLSKYWAFSFDTSSKNSKKEQRIV